MEIMKLYGNGLKELLKRVTRLITLLISGRKLLLIGTAQLVWKA